MRNKIKQLPATPHQLAPKRRGHFSCGWTSRDVFVGGVMRRRGGEMTTHRDGPAVFDVVNLIVKNHTTSNAVFLKKDVVVVG